jgi:DNA-binding MarR family transcriptional regulator
MSKRLPDEQQDCQAQPRTGADADVIDAYLDQWKALVPGLPTEGLAVSGRIARIAGLYRQLIAPVLGRHELEEWEYDVLATLRRSGGPDGLSMSELTTHMLLAPGSTTHRVELLVRRKLVVRRQDPESRRRVLVSLTAAGRARIDALIPQLSETLAAPVLALAPALRDDALHAVKALLGSLERVVDAQARDGAVAPAEPAPRKRGRTKSGR